jgi:hypothetical protein
MIQALFEIVGLIGFTLALPFLLLALLLNAIFGGEPITP